MPNFAKIIRLNGLRRIHCNIEKFYDRFDASRTSPYYSHSLTCYSVLSYSYVGPIKLRASYLIYMYNIKTRTGNLELFFRVHMLNT